MARASPPTLRFLFDIQCPYAYLASRRVQALALAAQAELEYVPVLLGGLYADSQAPQGKDGSASDVLAPQRRAMDARDLMREAQRRGVPLRFNGSHPVKSVKAQRLLCSVGDRERRARLAGLLFDAYWLHNEDVSDELVLLRAAQVCLDPTLSESRLREILSEDNGLRANTTWASSRGVFGVPAFFVGERYYHGQDRMHFVAQALGLPSQHPLCHPTRLYPNNPTVASKRRLVVYHDFSSPWSCLGVLQVESAARAAGCTEVVYKPILLGALFRDIGTPNVPMFAMSEAKRAYGARDLEDWKTYWGGVPLRFPEAFPLRTVTALRVAILEPRVTLGLYKAAWQQNCDLGDENQLTQAIYAAGFDGQTLVRRAKTEASLKESLAANNKEAVALGICGVPSFRVEGEVVWGQDRLNVVQDLLASPFPEAKL